MKKIAIIQPCFIPWMGYFEQMAVSDIFVYMDDVKYTKKDWRNSNQLLCSAGPKKLSIPVRKSKGEILINQALIANDLNWQEPLLNKISNWYKNAPFFENIYPILEEEIQTKYYYLMELTCSLNTRLASYMGISPKIHFSSEVEYSSEDKVEKIVEIVKHFDGTLLYDGKSAANFIDPKIFTNNNLSILFQDYKHSPYSQLHSLEFIPYMSIVDLLMNEGPNSLQIIMKSPRPISLSE